MSIIQGSSISAGSTESGGFYDFPIEQSLRFDGSSYLSRTPTTTTNSSRKTWTWSGWVKRQKLGVFQNIFSSGAASQTSNRVAVSFTTNDILWYRISIEGTDYTHQSNQVFRDLSSWYHFVVQCDTTQSTSANRKKVYVNGVEITSWEIEQNPNPDNETTTNSNVLHGIGANSYSTNGFSDGFASMYLANIQFIDGQALNSHYFGELKNGVWTPKAFDGTASDSNYTISGATSSYGTNGFHLQFNPADFNTSGGNQTVTYNGNSSTLPNNHVADVSGSGNHWELH